MPYYPTTTRAATSTGTSTSGSTTNDVLVDNGPGDSISALSWSPQANHQAIASWDGTVRIFDHTARSGGNGIAMINFEKPVLSCNWSPDGQKVVGSGLDKSARMLDLAANGAPAQQVASHDEAIKSVHFFEAPQSSATMIATGSWDKTIRYWDLRQSRPVAMLQCSERVYSMDVRGHLLTAATADRKVHVVDLHNPMSFSIIHDSIMKQQIRVVSCFTVADGFTIGGVGGRCEVQYSKAEDADLNFTFRCHRKDITTSKKSEVYAVNAVSIHPTNRGVLATAGADGTFHFWDIEARTRLRSFPTVDSTISAAAFNRDGTLYSYAISYDWSKGFAQHTPQYPNKVMIHPVGSDECKPKKTR